MKKLQKKRLEFKGGITVFLSLVFVLILSLIGALLQSASIQASKSIKRAEMNLALENMFAEYQVNLLKEYDLFVRVGSDESSISDRLKFYGITNTDQEITASTLLSDSNGLAFYKQAVSSMGGEVKDTNLSTENPYEPEEETVSEQLEDILQQEGQEFALESNPIEAVKNFKNSNLLSIIYPNPEQLSNLSVNLESFPSHRTLNKGVGSVSEKAGTSVANKLLFVQYLSEHFQNTLQSEAEHPLAYEIEYILGGCSSDQENLKEVVKKILSIRVAINYAYLMTDGTKQAEAEVMALALSGLMTAPGATEIVKQALLFAWSYGESVVDLKELLKGDKVPIAKTSETWQLQLSNVVQLLKGEDVAEEKTVSEGVSYKDYLWALLLAEEKETICMRALDLLELNTGVQVDDCITRLEIESTCQLRRGITYTFTTDYEYE